ncbi:MAG: glycosyltransferase family 1 protein [Corynebacterium sp.]|nr:glycosyltransferase family 1 protein [Corynebacterium sp.]
MKKVYYPGRILERNVGGNTTYTRAIAEGMRGYGWDVEALPYHSRATVTAVLEQGSALQKPVNGEVVHYSADTGPLLPVRRPSVVTVHGVASAVAEGVRNPVQEFVWRSRVRAAMRFTDALITVSNSSSETLQDVFGIESSKITVIPHGIDGELFASKASVSPEVQAQLPKEYLLYLGNIEPRKNLIELVEAVDQLRLPLVIAGRAAWNAEEIEARIAASPNTIRLGFVSNQDRVYLLQHCLAFVFPSLYEGFGFPVLEAMAAGAPVLATRRGSLRDVAGPAGLIEDVSAEAIEEALAKYVFDSAWREHVIPLSREWASKFDWERSVAAHRKLYEELVV